MAIKFDYDAARTVLDTCVQHARSGEDLPIEWRSHSTAVFDLTSKTYTTALATLLLAKSLNDQVDTLAIKVTDDRSYSMRGLGHGVIVPAAKRHGFSIRATGREPLNNQPWFRYNRIDEFERVKSKKDYDYFLAVARRANELSAHEAREALAAFIAVALGRAVKLKQVSVRVDNLHSEAVRIAVQDFLRRDAPDRPLRLQAFVAACVDVTHSDVRARRLNDPSRDMPGDVHAFAGEDAILAIEVRGKPVPPTEFAAFADACAEAEIRRAFLVVDADRQVPFDLADVESGALTRGDVQGILYHSAAEFSDHAIAWADTSARAAVTRLAERVLVRLREVEASRSALEEWTRAISVAQAV